MVDEFQPSVAILDPISNLISIGTTGDVYAALMRLIDFLKARRVTCVCTSLTDPGLELEHTPEGISSLMDTWILIKHFESNGERNRVLYVLKSRGMQALKADKREARTGILRRGSIGSMSCTGLRARGHPSLPLHLANRFHQLPSAAAL